MPSIRNWSTPCSEPSRIDADSLTVTDTIEVGDDPYGVAVSADAVWVTNSADDTVSRIG